MMLLLACCYLCAVVLQITESFTYEASPVSTRTHVSERLAKAYFSNHHILGAEQRLLSYVDKHRILCSNSAFAMLSLSVLAIPPNGKAGLHPARRPGLSHLGA